MLDYELSRLLLSLVALLFFSLVIGHIFSIYGLPRVVGEICSGLMLGPSLLGYFFPEFYAWVFMGFDEQAKLLSVFYWLGLILLMFTAGFKVSATIARGDRLIIAMLVTGGICLPFLFGYSAAKFLPNTMAAKPLAFSLVVAIASAVTSIPVITRIYIENNMLDGRFARTTLCAAAIQDLLLWIVLSIALSVQQIPDNTSVNLVSIFFVVISTVLFGIVVLLLLPPLVRFAGRVMNVSPEPSLMGFTLLACLFLVSVSSVLSINVVFGALLAGIVIGRIQSERLNPVKRSIENFAVWFFVPIYFSLVGLKLNLPNSFDLKLIIGFLFISSTVKVLSVAVFVKLSGTPWGRAFDFGVTMNTRGGPGIVLASLAYAAKIIDESFFIALVLASVVTALMAGVWLKARKGYKFG